MTTVVWHDGRILEPGENAVSPLSHGFTVGDGVYETIAVRNQRPFALTRHLLRLQASLKRTGLGMYNAEALNAGLGAVLAAGHGQHDARCGSPSRLASARSGCGARRPRRR